MSRKRAKHAPGEPPEGSFLRRLFKGSASSLPRDEVSGQAGTEPSHQALNGSETASNSTLRAIAMAATALWRVKRKLDEFPATDLPAGLRHLPRHVAAGWDALAAEGVEVIDPTGKPYRAGMTVKPVAFQPTPNIGADCIIETLKPSVVFGGKIIQVADVVVACPEGQSAEEPKTDNGDASHGT